DGPVVGFLRMSAPGIGVQVMDQVTAAQDEDALVAQRRQPSAYLEMVRRGLRLIDAQLNHRHIRIGIHMAKHGPCAMIETPGGIERHRKRRQRFLDAARQPRGTWGGILHVIELARKAAEVVDGSRRIAGRYTRSGHEPVGRDREDRPRPRQLFTDSPPALGVGVAPNGIHRFAVSEEDRGLWLGHRLALIVSRAFYMARGLVRTEAAMRMATPPASALPACAAINR